MREHGTCSSSVPRDAFFYASHFLRFQKRKKKKKIARETNDCCDWTNQGFFQEGGGGGGEGTREARGIIETKNINRVGVLRGRNGQKRQPSSPGWGVVRFSQLRILVANSIYTRVARVRTFEESFVSDWQRFRSSSTVTCKYRFLYKTETKVWSPTNEFEPPPL